MRNSLGLDDDLGDAELIQNLEASFGTNFSSIETKACGTVGDLFTLLKLRFSSNGVRNKGCPSAMAFYRLRLALKDAGVLLPLTPGARLNEISSLPPKVLFAKIKSQSSMRLPRLQPGALGRAGQGVTLLAILAFLVLVPMNLRLALVPLSAAGIGGILMRFDRGEFPNDQTLGDLARKVAGLNFGRLVTLGAGQRDRDLWEAFLEVITEHSPTPKDEIVLETLLLQKQLRAT